MKRLISTLNLSKEDWLRYCKCGITGTDAGAILGLNPYRSAFQVYHDKISDTFENIDNDKIVGAYAVAIMENGEKIAEVMTMAQIKTAWRQGYGYKENGNGVHQKFTDQMAMKTVKNRLLKAINNTHSGFGKEDDYGEISRDEMLEQDVAYDIEQNANSVDFDEDNIIDVEPTNTTDKQSEELPPFMQE